LLTKISTDNGTVISEGELERILRMAFNVHTLEIYDFRGIQSRPVKRQCLKNACICGKFSETRVYLQNIFQVVASNA
jgi:hypothetical protein